MRGPDFLDHRVMNLMEMTPMKRLRIVRWLQGYGFETEIVQSVTRVDDGARIVYYLLDSEGLKYQAPGSNEVAVKVKNVDTYPFDRK